MYLNLQYMVMMPANKKDKNLDSIMLTSNLSPTPNLFILQIAVLDIINTHKLQL